MDSDLLLVNFRPGGRQWPNELQAVLHYHDHHSPVNNVVAGMALINIPRGAGGYRQIAFHHSRGNWTGAVVWEVAQNSTVKRDVELMIRP